MDFTFGLMIFVLVVILQSFALYCIDAYFISVEQWSVQFSRKLFLVYFRVIFWLPGSWCYL